MAQNDQTLSRIKTWLDFALQQVAADSYLQGIDLSVRAQVVARMTRGNSPIQGPDDQFLRMTSGQADAFFDRYLIVDHHANDSSGFSATLLFDTHTQQYTLAMRSTEYKNPSLGGDYDRDGFFGAGGEINKYGFAFGQLAALEDYYSRLRAGALAGQGPINLVGYSLSGHLALVFTELHPEDVIRTQVFNSAGRGQLSVRPGLGVFDMGSQVENIRAMLGYYRQVLLNPSSAADAAKASAAGLFQLARDLQLNQGVTFRPFESVPQSLNFGTQRPNLLIDPRHHFARVALEQRYSFDFSTPLFRSPNPAASPFYTQPGKVTQLFGHANHGDAERVANSGVHPEATPIVVEGQPFIEGVGGRLAIAPEITEFLSKSGDFGNTHSLTLIIDSLSLMSIFMDAAPVLTKRDVETIIAAASNARAKKLFAPQGAGQSNAEGDSLELAIDALRKLYGAAGRNPQNPSQLITDTEDVRWRTPADPRNGGFGDVNFRNRFHQNIELLQAEVATRGNVVIRPLVANTLLSEINGEPVATLNQGVTEAALIAGALSADGIAYRYALMELNPFIAEGNAALYAPHNRNGELNLADVSGAAGMTLGFIQDRAGMLAWKLEQAVANRHHSITTDATSIKYWDETLRKATYVFSQDRASGVRTNEDTRGNRAAVEHERTFGQTVIGGTGQIVAFGRESDALRDTLRGAQSADHLYGQSGDDVLVGFAGRDTLEGGRGTDLLDGGIGSDTYIWNKGDGFDTITDVREGADNKKLGDIQFLNQTLAGDKTQIRPDNPQLFTDERGILYTLIGTPGADGLLTVVKPFEDGGLHLAGFKSGDFGIIIPVPTVPPKTDRFGTARSDNSASTQAGRETTLTADAPNQKVFGLGGNDRIIVALAGAEAYGGLGHDYITNDTGNQKLFGDEGNDILIASGGNDELYGGLDNDALQGGADDDYLDGGEGDDFLDGGPGSDVIVGGLGHDFILGGGNMIPAISEGEIDDPNVRQFGSRVLNGEPGFINMAGTVAVAGDGVNIIDAGAGDDAVFGGEGEDYIDGGADQDLLVGLAGRDSLLGGPGNDRLFGDATEGAIVFRDGQLAFTLPQFHAADYLDGGEGDDVLTGDGGADLLFGGLGADILIGDDSRLEEAWHGMDYLDGGDGNDELFGYGKDDVLLGGAGDDRLEGDSDTIPFESHGVDYLDGEAGNDILAGAGGADTLFGGDGDDQLFGDSDNTPVANQGDDYLDGEAGKDFLRGYSGNDVLIGGEGDDELIGEAGEDTLDGGAGTDVLVGGEGADVYLADFEDIINDDSGDDLIDLVVATPGELTVAQFDSNGQPTLVISRNEEGNPAQGLTIVGDVTEQNLRFAFGVGELTSDAFFDIAFKSSLDLAGTDDDDVLRGFGGSDTLRGFAGNDSLNGGAGNDVIEGAEGDDTLEGGAGSDVLSGGAGSDVYIFGRASGLDEINDTGGNGIDRIALAPDVLRGDIAYEHSIFGDLALILSPDARLTVHGHFASSANRIEEIQFADGSVVTAAELDAVTLPPITGTDGADTLVGTQFAETFVGVAGDDTLDGKGGNDVLHGGEGLDTYAFNLSMGWDIFVDDRGRIKLQPGLGFNDLHAAAEGNDLELKIRGTAEGALLFNYLVSPQDWTIEDATGAQTTPQAVLEATAQREQDWVGTQRDDYRTALKAEIASRYLSFGYDLTPEGTYFSPWQARPWLGEVTAAASWNTQTQTVTVNFFSGATSSTTTTGGFTSWNHATPSLLESTVHINEETIASDDPQIFALSGRMDTTNDGQPVIANVTWSGLKQDFGTISESTFTDFILGPERDPITGQLIASGTVTTTSLFHSFSGVVTGQVNEISPGGTARGGLFPQFIIAELRVNTITEHIAEVIAGPGDNEIFGGRLIDAGDGNDIVLSAGGFLYGGAGDDVIGGGDIAIGGPGNDTISGAIIAHGGAGDDYLNGGFGASHFVFDVEDLGQDTVTDSRGLSVDEFAGWYYSSIGIPEWRSILVDPETENRISIERGAALGLLPPLPQIAADDWSALAPLYAAGVIEMDTVEFVRSITPGDLSLALGEVTSISPVSGVLETYTTLDVSWSPGNVARIVIPHAEDPLGTGVERFKFADGTTLSLAQMLARNTPNPLPAITGTENDDVLVGTFENERILGLGGNDELMGLEGNDELDGGPGNDYLAGGDGDDVYVFGQGAGVDLFFDQGGADVIRIAEGIVPEGVLVTTDPYGTLYLVLPGSGDRLVLLDWFNDPALRVESAQFSDGTNWNVSELQSRVATLSATGFGDVLTETDGDDTIDGLGGDDEIYGLSGNDILRGGEGADMLTDWQGNNFLDGGTGDDHLYADGAPNFAIGGNNFVLGGAGDDRVNSYAAGNVIAFNPGDGHDTVYAANSLTLSLGGGIAPSALSLSQDGTDLVLTIGATDSIRLTRQFELDPEAWPQITLQLYGSVHFFDFNAVITDFRQAVSMDPLLQDFALDAVLQAHQTTVSESEAFGGALAHRYAITGNLNGLSDTTILQVLGNPDFGAALQTIRIGEANHAPTLANPISDQIAFEDAAFSFVVPATTFSDIDFGDALDYSAIRADGSMLPAWLTFNAATRTLSGTPANEDVGTVGVRLTASDGASASVSDLFDLTVANTNDTPVLGHPIADQSARAGVAFDFALATDSFHDIDPDEVLSYRATLANGDRLPAWLTFDASSRNFSGTPAATDAGAISIRVTAFDLAGTSETDDFELVMSDGGTGHGEDPGGMDHNDDRGHDHGKRDDEHHRKREGSKHDDRDEDRSEHKGDRITQWLTAYFERKPDYDFEALAQELERSDRHREALNAHEIARRWRAVDRYASALSSEHDEDTWGGADVRFNDFGLLDRGAFGDGFGHSASTGALRRGANLQTLQGLEEGFQRLHS